MSTGELTDEHSFEFSKGCYDLERESRKLPKCGHFESNEKEMTFKRVV